MSSGRSTTDPQPPVSRRNLLRAGAGLGVGAALTPALLSACGGSGKETKPVASSASTTPTAPAKPSPAAGAAPEAQAKLTPGVYYPTNYVGPKARQVKPFGDGSTVFSVVVPEDTATVGDWNKSKFSKWFEERTGVKVKYQTVSTAGGDMTKVNAMVASGDLPDAFLNIPFSRDQISLYGQQGALAPLDEFIDKYAGQLTQAMQDYPDLKALAKGTDGKTYVFPSVNDCRQCKVSPGRAWVNKKFLDAVDMKAPQTTDDFRAMLKAFKTRDPNGHGDTVPFAAGASSPIDRFFMNAFTYNPGSPWLRLNGDKVEFVANTAEWRDGLRYLRLLHDDGTLTPSAFTMTDQALQKLGNTPGHARIGVARCYYWGIFMEIVTKPDARWHDYVPVPALKGPNDVRYAAWDYYQPYLLNSFVVTKACKHPEVMVRWADYQMELEATMRSAWGLEGKDWSWAPKADKSIAGKQAIWRQYVGGSEGSVPLGHGWNQHAVMYRSNDFRLGEEYNPKNPAFASILDQATIAPYYEPYKQPKKLQLPPLIFEQSAAATNADTALAVQNHVNQSMAEFAVGKLDVDDDSVWKTYATKIDQMGLSQYLKNYQDAYDHRQTA